jgi:hypothetical protein
VAREPEGRLQVCLRRASGRDGELGPFSNIILKKERCCDWLSADLFLVYCVLCSVIMGFPGEGFDKRERQLPRAYHIFLVAQGQAQQGHASARVLLQRASRKLFGYLAKSITQAFWIPLEEHHARFLGTS